MIKKCGVEPHPEVSDIVTPQDFRFLGELWALCSPCILSFTSFKRGWHSEHAVASIFFCHNCFDLVLKCSESCRTKAEFESGESSRVCKILIIHLTSMCSSERTYKWSLLNNTQDQLPFSSRNSLNAQKDEFSAWSLESHWQCHCHFTPFFLVSFLFIFLS